MRWLPPWSLTTSKCTVKVVYQSGSTLKLSGSTRDMSERHTCEWYVSTYYHAITKLRIVTMLDQKQYKVLQIKCNSPLSHVLIIILALRICRLISVANKVGCMKRIWCIKPVRSTCLLKRSLYAITSSLYVAIYKDCRDQRYPFQAGKWDSNAKG